LDIRNISFGNVAWFGNEGNIVLKGTCTISSNCISPANPFIIANSTDNSTAYIDREGNLCLEFGDCSDQSTTCTAPSNSFIIKDSNNITVSYIDNKGDLGLTENSNDLDSSSIDYNFTYDLNGNIIQDESNYYEYNSFNQLIKVRGNNSNGAVTEEYFYNGNGNRLMKVSYLGNNTNNTEYYFDETFVKRINSTGVFNEEYVYHDSTLIATIKPDGTKEFSHPDHLGSTTLITNFSGNLVEETTYYPFGSVFDGSNIGISRSSYTLLR